jgi:ribosomal protein L2
MLPGKGSYFCRAAGTSATLVKKIGERVVLKMPNKKEYSFDEQVMAMVGKWHTPIDLSLIIPEVTWI